MCKSAALGSLHTRGDGQSWIQNARLAETETRKRRSYKEFIIATFETFTSPNPGEGQDGGSVGECEVGMKPDLRSERGKQSGANSRSVK